MESRKAEMMRWRREGNIAGMMRSPQPPNSQDPSSKEAPHGEGMEGEAGGQAQRVAVLRCVILERAAKACVGLSDYQKALGHFEQA